MFETQQTSFTAFNLYNANKYRSYYDQVEFYCLQAVSRGLWYVHGGTPDTQWNEDTSPAENLFYFGVCQSFRGRETPADQFGARITQAKDFIHMATMANEPQNKA